MSTSYTYYFNEVFKDYNEWKAFIQTTGIVNYDSELESAYDLYFYKLLAYHFSHCNIRYFEIGSFTLELTIIYENKFKQYIHKIENAQKLYNLTEQEILLIDKMLIDQEGTGVNNQANNPNDEVTQPLQPLNYISQQNYLKNTNNSIQQRLRNKLDGMLDYIERVQGLNSYDFIFKRDNERDLCFNDLFMQVLPHQENLYKKEGY